MSAAVIDTPVVVDSLEKALNGVSPEVASYITKALADRDDRATAAEALVADAIAKAAVAEDERLTAVYVAKAAEFGQPETFGPILKAVSLALPAVMVDELHRVLKAATEQAKAGALFTEVGSVGRPVTETGTTAEIVQKAREAGKAIDPTFTNAEALIKGLDTDPALKAAYHKSLEF